ncbi:MAG TPA: signal peptidase I [Verrucomicrobiae bacterium]|nr:signal peptidase I [Verrucomicrobiae bacterium]
MIWFRSKTAREARALHKHIQKLLNHQRDILSPQAIQSVEESLRSVDAALKARAADEEISRRMEQLVKTADGALKPYPNAAWRENVEVLLVALAVAMGIRTFFLQPFKIPTGSMQPTLFGVTSEPDYSRMPPNTNSDFKVPTGWARVKEWFQGVSYVHVVAKNDGELERIDPPVKLLIFNLFQKLVIGGETYWIWFPPDYGDPRLDRLERAGLRTGMMFHKGDDVVRLRITSGDHLFVDRFTYNFFRPSRGEIIVFETKGINNLPQDQFYIKRMVALGGERVQIGDDRHLIINGRRLDASVPHFEKVYSFDPKQPPRESQYSGHVNEKTYLEYRPDPYEQLAPNFPDQSAVYEVRPDHFMVMGDNTMNSLDSRNWGDFPAGNVIGKSFFVYWPFSTRFGWGYHR